MKKSLDVLSWDPLEVQRLGFWPGDIPGICGFGNAGSFDSEFREGTIPVNLKPLPLMNMHSAALNHVGATGEANG